MLFFSGEKSEHESLISRRKEGKELHTLCYVMLDILCFVMLCISGRCGPTLASRELLPRFKVAEQNQALGQTTTHTGKTQHNHFRICPSSIYTPNDNVLQYETLQRYLHSKVYSNSHKPYEFIHKSCSIVERNISAV